VNGENFMIGTTHFTWTFNGETDSRQEKDLSSLFEVLDGIPELILCGDFNAPRGKKVWSALSSRYIDHIPLEYTSSIDSKLHRKKDLHHLVDGLFSTPHYETKNVRIVCNVSDHCAVVAEIYKKTENK